MQRREWSTLADWFDEQQGDAGDLWHRTLIFPGILKVIGKVSGRERNIRAAVNRPARASIWNSCRLGHPLAPNGSLSHS